MMSQTVVASIEGIAVQSIGKRVKDGIRDFVDELVDYIFYGAPVKIDI